MPSILPLVPGWRAPFVRGVHGARAVFTNEAGGVHARVEVARIADALATGAAGGTGAAGRTGLHVGAVVPVVGVGRAVLDGGAAGAAGGVRQLRGDVAGLTRI